jgi:hypothetical protein
MGRGRSQTDQKLPLYPINQHLLVDGRALKKEDEEQNL